jgi:hypothetical protein
MALTGSSTLSDALAQYKSNLCWWETPAKAANLLEAVLYLLACKPQMLAAADQSVSFASLQALQAKLEPIVAGTAATRNRASFVIGRVHGR